MRLRHFGHFGDMSKQAVHAIQAGVDLFLALAMNVTQGAVGVVLGLLYRWDFTSFLAQATNRIVAL